MVDVGLDAYPTVWMRLAGIDAPELYHPGGQEALEFVRKFAPPGEPCRIYTDKRPQSRREQRSFTRYVGRVVLAGDRDVGETLVAMGHAARWSRE